MLVVKCYLGTLNRGSQNLGKTLSERKVLKAACRRKNAAARRKKDLILSVRSFCLCVLIRGLENLESPCEGVRIVTFCVVQKVLQKHARTCKKLPVASFCASETAETGRIANGREQGDHVSRRSRAAALWTPGSDSNLLSIHGFR